MCGRFQVNIDEPELLEILNDLQKEGREPSELGEMYPTELAPALAARNGSVAAGLFRWGYEKFDGKGVLINARAETVREKPLFRRDFFERRCAIPASGFFEWSPDKTKYYFRKQAGGLLYLGGFFKRSGGEEKFIILTKDATPPVSQFHHRIPVLVEKDALGDWLTDISFASDYLYRDNPVPLIY